ncbi:MAG: alpha/beta fold hydrolase [Clostridia bacterium]|nr:alpha/beta fold hydrolase [Clostridia bacterium]
MENASNQLFINSDQVGDKISILLPGFDGVEEETDIHYLESGIGEPLLLIHGIGQSLYTWRKVFSELSESYRVIALDLPGHGYSDRPESLNDSMESMAEVIRLLLDAKGITSAHMVGFSTGAMYMLRFLSLYEDRVANCIAIAPGGITKRMPKLIHNIKRRFTAVFARNLFTAGDVRKLLEDCVYDDSLVDDRMVRQYYSPLSDGLSREALMYALRNFDMDTVAEGLIPCEHEVLVLWGKEDSWHHPSDSVYFQNILQNGRYYLFKRTGHLLQEEKPEKLLDVIFSYIPALDSYENEDARMGAGYGMDLAEDYEGYQIPVEGAPVYADPTAYNSDYDFAPLEGFQEPHLPEEADFLGDGAYPEGDGPVQQEEPAPEDPEAAEPDLMEDFLDVALPGEEEEAVTDIKLFDEEE